jgi:hypothetical protein
VGDACDLDGDNDGFVDSGGPVEGRASEAYLGTDPSAACSDIVGHDAWPPDINMDRVVNVLDVLQYSGKIGLAVGDDPALRRLDLDQDGSISVTGDVDGVLQPYLNQTCTN